MTPDFSRLQRGRIFSNHLPPIERRGQSVRDECGRAVGQLADLVEPRSDHGKPELSDILLIASPYARLPLGRPRSTAMWFSPSLLNHIAVERGRPRGSAALGDAMSRMSELLDSLQRLMKSLPGLLSKVQRLTKHIIGHIGDGFLQVK